MNMNTRLTMLGTGSAFPSQSYHTCFLLRCGDSALLADGGGGMEILQRLSRAKMPLEQLRHIFVSHVHTDHIFGVVWVIRRIVQMSLEDRYQGTLTVYGNAQVTDAMRTICRLTLLPAYFERMERIVELHTVAPGDEVAVGPMSIRFVDACSRGCDQTGFVATLPGGMTLGFLGDESLTERNRLAVAGVDYLLCGAYCSFADREIFRPYEKHHHTVRDVAAEAAAAGVGTLVLCHCEDRHPEGRASRYAAEAAEFFDRPVLTPLDFDEIRIPTSDGNEVSENRS